MYISLRYFFLEYIVLFSENGNGDCSCQICHCSSPKAQTIVQHIGSPQSFWHQGLVLWKTIFPHTRNGGCFQDDSSALHSLCTLFLFLLHQFHIISSGIRFQRLGTPALRHSKLNRGLQNTINADFCLRWECKMVAPLKDSLAVFYKTKKSYHII